MTVFWLFTPYHSNAKRTIVSFGVSDGEAASHPLGNEEETRTKIQEGWYTFFDMGVNIMSKQYRGFYDSSTKRHQSDIDNVIERANSFGVNRMLFMANSPNEISEVYKLTQDYPDIYMSFGINPSIMRKTFIKSDNLKSFQSDFEKNIDNFISNKSKLVAIGDWGLDYAKFKFSEKVEQLKIFPLHFALAKKYGLPMIMKCNQAAEDFVKIVKDHRKDFSNGLISAFKGTEEELQQLLDLGMYIGVSGCSMKNKQMIDMIRLIPLDKIILQTMSPSCVIKDKHSGYHHIKSRFSQVKNSEYEAGKLIIGRNEPCTIVQLVEIVAKVKGIDEKEVMKAVWDNSNKFIGKN